MPVSDALLNALLAQLHEVVDLGHAIDERPRRFDTDFPLSRAEIHTVSAVAESPGIGLTALAEQQAVTKGAASQMVSRLVQKGLIHKERGAGREISLSVTDTGARAHDAHMAFHRRMFEAVRPAYADDITLLRDVEALTRLLNLMRQYSQDET